jgi:hypothetical protein
MRDRNSSQSEFTYAIADAPSPIRRAGRRPYRSEKRPHIGALMICATANDATSAPTIKPPAPMFLA